MLDVCLITAEFGQSATRRTQAFIAAMQNAKVLAQSISYQRAHQCPEAIPAARWYKFDAPGGDEYLDNYLCAQAATPPARARAHGELYARAAWFDGFRQVLNDIAQRLPPTQIFNSVDSILLMLDKLACQQHFQAHGLLTPQLLGSVQSFDQLSALMQQQGAERLFFKPRYGSSAAGVVAIRTGPGGKWQAQSSCYLEDGKLLNSLQIRRYHRQTDIAALIDQLAKLPNYIEAWIAKPAWPTDRRLVFDLRVIAFGGRMRQAVARLSQFAMTNLHLGNQRAPLPTWSSPPPLQQCVQAAAASLPGANAIGFDVICAGQKIYLLEANAFGDFVQGATIMDHGTTAFAIASAYDDQAQWFAANAWPPEKVCAANVKPLKLAHV